MWINLICSVEIDCVVCFYVSLILCRHFSSLIQDLKERMAEFPDVDSGVYVYEVIHGTAASR